MARSGYAASFRHDAKKQLNRYGISDFDSLITRQFHYVDRTDHIPLLEEAGDQLLFLQPRRFGKSLLLSMLENYMPKNIPPTPISLFKARETASITRTGMQMVAFGQLRGRFHLGGGNTRQVSWTSTKSPAITTP
uniref:Predicted AAA-ATPase n=1 Tax=Candidatus Kentrum sp. FW TaxID=2126338 RepID=A0A450U3J4_9GAMM|nr:MAG: Predicted AAA-ATPase [Candidatus Kentron sp. FW]